MSATPFVAPRKPSLPSWASQLAVTDVAAGPAAAGFHHQVVADEKAVYTHPATAFTGSWAWAAGSRGGG